MHNDNFQEPCCRKIIFSLQGYLQRITFAGHQIKVNITAAKQCDIPSSHNVKLRWAINSASMENRAVKIACSMKFLAY